MKTSAVIDPRLHDAVIFDLDGVVTDTDSMHAVAPAVALVRKLAEVGVTTAVYSARRPCEQVLAAAGLDDLFAVRVDGHLAADPGLPAKPDPAGLLEISARLRTAPERSVVIDDSAAGMRAGNAGGFALVIGVAGAGRGEELQRSGADVVVADLVDVTVRAGDKRVSELSNALDAYAQVIAAIDGRRPFVCLDYDGTLSDIVSDPDRAALVDGAADALTRLAQQCPVAILSGRDLADVRARVAVPGLWYAGSHGFEMVGPDGTEYHNDSAADAVPALQQAADTLRDQLSGVAGARVEHKRYAVAVHYRNVSADRVAEIVAATRGYGNRFGLRVTTGRKVIELRPDIDWDKGTALKWIQDRLPPEARRIPIYIGDDLTDEDAFDSLRAGGVGIAVRHDEDHGRPTAALFTLANPRQVQEFLRRGGNWLQMLQATSTVGWTYTFDGYDPPTEKLREALCTVGNGYFATRGAAPESKAGQVHYPGTYASGLYNRLDDVLGGKKLEHESLVNLPNWLPLTFRINNGNWFDVDAVTLLDYRQTFDLRGGALTRALRFSDDDGRITSVTQRRLISMKRPNVAALETTIVAENWSGTVEIRSTLDANVRNGGVERYRELASNHLESLKMAEIADNSVLMTVQTSQSQIPIAFAARTTVWHGANAATAKYRLVEKEFEIGHEVFVDMTEGQSLTVEKVVTLVTGRDVATSEPASGARRRLARQGRFAGLYQAHTLAWAHIWERLSIEFDGHPEELRIMRLHLLHLLQTVSYHSEDLDVGVPARGLHGEAYRGHVFWDELFIFPVLNLRLPTITRALLRYRYRRLIEARRAAKLAGYAGAMFPWQSGSDGREESPSLHLNPRSGRWNPDASHLAHHIGIAVAYNVWQFYQVTGDLAYLIDYGAEMLIEIARFWVSRTTYDKKTDRYGILGVIGPDEFHSGYPDRPFTGVDNNSYTNVMAVWVILRAIEALQEMPLPNRLDLREKVRLNDDELEQWDRVSRRMFVAFHDGLISQFENYDQLAELDWDSYRKRYGNIQRLDRILEAEGDDINRYRASKQADALMLLYLLSSDELRELLNRLGYHLAPEKIPAMVDYYIARTSHGSTLSGVVHSWVLARANRDRALEFFRHVLKSDVDDIQGGTTSEGVHLAAMAGSVDLVQRCFTGLEVRANRIVLSPNWPESLGALGFPIHYRGHHLHVRVSGRGAEVSVGPHDLPPIVIECRGRTQKLAPGSIIRFPSEADPSQSSVR